MKNLPDSKYKDYMSHNPPGRIEEGGVSYILRTTFKTKSEADFEYRDIRDHYKKAKIKPFYNGYAVYEEE